MINYQFQINYKIKIKQKACGKLCKYGELQVFDVTEKLNG